MVEVQVSVTSLRILGALNADRQSDSCQNPDLAEKRAIIIAKRVTKQKWSHSQVYNIISAYSIKTELLQNSELTDLLKRMYGVSGFFGGGNTPGLVWSTGD